MKDFTKSRRLLDMRERLMRGERLTAKIICEDYGVDRRTVNRDVDELESFGLELSTGETFDGKRSWSVAERAKTIDVTYTVNDVMALFFGRRLFDFLEGTTLESSLKRVYGRIESQLTRQKMEMAKKLPQKLYLVHEGPKKLPTKTSEILDECLSALIYETKLRLKYTSLEGRSTTFIALPYTLVAYKRGLYLAAASENEPEEIKTYALERIKKADWLKGDEFSPPKDYFPEKFFSKAFFLVAGQAQEVELLFSATTEPFIRIREFHPSQKIRKMNDGKIRMRLDVPINFEILNWVLSFGSHVEVVKPKELKDMVVAEYKKALGNYE